MNKLCDNSGQEIEVGDIICLWKYPDSIGLVLELPEPNTYSTRIKIFDMQTNTAEHWHPRSQDLKLVSKGVME